MIFGWTNIYKISANKILLEKDYFILMLSPEKMNKPWEYHHLFIFAAAPKKVSFDSNIPHLIYGL